MRKKIEYSKEERINIEIYRNSLWQKIIENQIGKKYDVSFDKSQISFLQNCMNENLSHARHAEIERLTFNSFFVALTAGALAFISQTMQDKIIAFIICILMIVFSTINLVLTHRWNTCYSRYMYYAKKCYKTLRIMMFGYNDNDNPLLCREHIDDESLEINEYPIFCFNVVYGQRKFMKSKLLIFIFNIIFIILWVSVFFYLKHH